MNPSQEVVRVFDVEEFSGFNVAKLQLPVERYAAVESTLEAIEVEVPDIVIMLGQAAKRSRISLERVAINIDDFEQTDNAGNQPQSETISQQGAVAYFATLPLSQIAKAVTKRGIPCEISNTAGTYVCNRLFYSVMQYAAQYELSYKAGFIHLPYLPQQTSANTKNAPSMALETMSQAIRIIVESLS